MTRFKRAYLRTEFFSGPEPRLFAHRGASARAPENTLESFRLALAAGAPYFELDVRLSADGSLMVIHDPSVIRTTSRRGQVEKLTLGVLRELDAGWGFTPDHGHSFPYRGRGLRIPTLEEVLTSFPEARLTIEIKRSRPGVAEAVAQVVRRLAADSRILVASFEHDLLCRFRELAPSVPTAFSKLEVRQFLARVREGSFADYQAPGEALQVPEYFGLRRVVSPALLDAAHARGVEVHVWGVNEISNLRRLVSLGVDGLMVDDPAAVLAAIEELGETSRAASAASAAPRAGS